MKKIFRRNKPLIFLVIVLILSDCILYTLWKNTHVFTGMVKVNKDMGKSLITVDTVLIGFSYTALNTMLSFSNNSSFNVVDRDGYIDKYYNGVYISIALLFFSVMVGFVTGYSCLGEKYHWIFMLQFILNLNSFVMFGYTIIKFRGLINWVRHRKIKELKNSPNK